MQQTALPLEGRTAGQQLLGGLLDSKGLEFIHAIGMTAPAQGQGIGRKLCQAAFAFDIGNQADRDPIPCQPGFRQGHAKQAHYRRADRIGNVNQAGVRRNQHIRHRNGGSRFGKTALCHHGNQILLQGPWQGLCLGVLGPTQQQYADIVLLQGRQQLEPMWLRPDAVWRGGGHVDGHQIRRTALRQPAGLEHLAGQHAVILQQARQLRLARRHLGAGGIGIDDV
ncbi:hypothetical protein DLM_4563 [Aquitalea magnusonii]|uniref:Uncharacterized protein n=1 Tax=Aquitalea magnusonii TaxID=332411 RepID=A0A3G9GSD8_9NEIS|nr:hypothetical protein DLM_4563 [Aquitalea magnusonii]